jgi:thiosulfate reductase cytochrome b subunit
MSSKKMTNIYLYTRYERSWHWLQMALIVILLLTGFEIHENLPLIGFETAVWLHNLIGLFWLFAFAFYIFWVFTTGEWRQYTPTSQKMLSVVRYYGFGIFKGESHPVPKRKDAKHNPLQRLVYLSLATCLLPFQMISGVLYWWNDNWPQSLGFLSLKVLAVVHTLGAFAILSFVIVHVYMTTTGHSLFAHIKAMITGWEEVEEGTTVEEWEQAEKRDAPSI